MTSSTEIYQRFADYTVMPEPLYTGTLRLALVAAAVPGAFVECGSWRGGLMAGIASRFIELGLKYDYVLCDSFDGLPDPTDADGPKTKAWMEANGRMNNAPEQYAMEAMKLAGCENYTLAKGWFKDTLPGLKFANGISFLHLDADLFASTTQALEALWDKVNDGGIIVFDDYYFLDGVADAVHLWLAERVTSDRIEMHGSWQQGTGVAFIRKGKDWSSGTVDEENDERTHIGPWT